MKLIETCYISSKKYLDDGTDKAKIKSSIEDDYYEVEQKDYYYEEVEDDDYYREEVGIKEPPIVREALSLIRIHDCLLRLKGNTRNGVNLARAIIGALCKYE